MKIIRIVILLALIVIACWGLLKWTHGNLSIRAIGSDFMGYWASTHLLLNGEDPYDSEKIMAVQKSLGWTEKVPIVIYNPPWVFTFLIPFCMNDFTTDRIIWVICTLSFMMFSADRLWLIYGGSRETRIWALIVMATFIPMLPTYILGQIVPLMLLGLMGFLYFARKEKWWLAGMMTMFIAVKPHVIYLFWFALLLWAMKQRLWPVLLASVLTFLCALLLPLFYNPNVYSQYFINIASKSFALYWATPTLGFLLRLYFGLQYGWLQYIPIAAGLIWFIAYWRKYRNMWIWEDRLPPLILVSLMTNFYTWSWDCLMLLPAIIQATVMIFQTPGVRHSGWIVFLYLMINVSGPYYYFFMDRIG